MKLVKQKSLNEMLAEVETKDRGVVTPVYADAVRKMKERKDNFDKIVKPGKVEMPNEDRDAHAKVSSNKELKKMHLSESLFTEWIEDTTLTESFAQAQLVLDSDAYQLADNGDVLISTAFFNDYMEGSHINIQFLDNNDDKVMTYKMVAESPEWITMEYVGEAEPGIDEEIIDCQKYPVEKPWKAKDSQYISAKDKEPNDLAKAVNTGFVSAGDKQPNKAAMKEDFTNWDSPESRVERYVTDLPELIDTMYDHFKRGNIEAQAFADALKIAYDTLDEVPHINEEVEASQKYPVETPFQAKDSQFISKEDKTPNDQVKAKDSQYISAGDKDPNKFNQSMKESVEDLQEGAPRKEGSTFLYFSERDPLGDVIQAELTEGEWGYVKSPEGKISLTRLPSANYLDDKVSASWDRNDRYAITVQGSSEEELQAAIDIANKYGKEYKLEKITRPLPGKEYCLYIYVDEVADFEEPYFDPNVAVRDGKKKKKAEDDFDESFELEEGYMEKAFTAVLRSNGKIFWAYDNDNRKYTILAAQAQMKKTNAEEACVLDNSKGVSIWNAKEGEKENPKSNAFGQASNSGSTEGTLDVSGGTSSINFFAGEIYNHFNKKYSVEIIDGYKIHIIGETKDLTNEINKVKNVEANNVEADSEKLSDGSYVYMLKRKAVMTMKNEEIESEQKFPVESPIAEEVESSQKYPVDFTETKALNEIRIETEGLSNFKPFGEKALETYNTIVSNGKLETLEFMLEDMYPSGIGYNELNTLLTEESDWLFKMLNITEDGESVTAEAEVVATSTDDEFNMNID